MKTLQEIKQELTDDIDKNIEILVGYTTMPLKKESDIVFCAEINAYLKDVIGNDMQRINKYKDIVIEVDNKFFQYIYKKALVMDVKRNWEEMLGLITKLIDYFQLKLDYMSFESKLHYIIYSMQTQKYVPFRSGIDGWVYCERAIIYRNLGLNDFALRDLYLAKKQNPMSFLTYIQLFLTLIENNNFDDLKNELDESYKIIFTKTDLGMYYYFYSVYYFNKGNILLANACANYAISFNIPIEYKNLANKLLADIIVKQDVIKTSLMKPYLAVLKENNLPLSISTDIKFTLVALYQKASKLKELKTYPTLLQIMKDNHLEDYLEYSKYPKNNEKMYIFEHHMLSLVMPENFVVPFRNINKIEKVGAIIEFSGTSKYNATMFLDTTIDFNCKDEEQILEEYARVMEPVDYEKLDERYLRTINKGIYIVKNKVKNGEIVDYYVFRINDYIAVITVIAEECYNDKEILKVIDSVKHFSSIYIDIR